MGKNSANVCNSVSRSRYSYRCVCLQSLLLLHPATTLTDILPLQASPHLLGSFSQMWSMLPCNPTIPLLCCSYSIMA